MASAREDHIGGSARDARGVSCGRNDAHPARVDPGPSRDAGRASRDSAFVRDSSRTVSSRRSDQVVTLAALALALAAVPGLFTVRTIAQPIVVLRDPADRLGAWRSHRPRRGAFVGRPRHALRDQQRHSGARRHHDLEVVRRRHHHPVDERDHPRHRPARTRMHGQPFRHHHGGGLIVDSAKAPRILIVEDEAIVALDIEERLRRLGYEVVGIADSCAGALASAAALHPDLVLMDVELRNGTGADGIAAAEQLRANLAVPVVFLTAYSDAATLERAKRASPHGYVVKPFEERDLRATLEIALYRDGVDRAMRRSHEDLLAVLNVQRVGILLIYEAGRILFANAAASRILGAEPRMLANLPWSEGLGLAGEARSRLEAPFRTPVSERPKVVVHLESRGARDWMVEIEIEDDPRAPQRKIFFLTDVSELHDLRRLLDEQARFHDLVGRSEEIQLVVRLVQQVARTDVTVVIEG